MLSIMICEEDRRQVAVVTAARSVIGNPIMPFGETYVNLDASVSLRRRGT